MSIDQEQAATEQDEDVEPLAFYLSMECDTCGEDMYVGLCVTMLTHQGRPVVPFDEASQTRFDCESCGGVSYTGDFADVDHEPGDESDNEDDDTGEDDD